MQKLQKSWSYGAKFALQQTKIVLLFSYKKGKDINTINMFS